MTFPVPLVRAAKSFVICKGEQHLNIAPLHQQRELAPAELQDCRKDDKEKSQDLTRQRRVREDNPYSVLSMKQRHRALEHLFFLNTAIPPPAQHTFGVGIQYVSAEPPRDTEVIMSKGCKSIRRVSGLSIFVRTISFYI